MPTPLIAGTFELCRQARDTRLSAEQQVRLVRDSRRVVRRSLAKNQSLAPEVRLLLAIHRVLDVG